jgi:hypothetical protein
MYNSTARLKSVCGLSVIALLLGSMGCVSPLNTRYPMVVHRPAEMERREAQVHDPYPDSKFGPDTGVRPLGYNEQRSEPQRAKDRYFTAILRTQNGNPNFSRPAAPLFAPQTMMPQNPQQYPQQYPQPGGYPVPTQVVVPQQPGVYYPPPQYYQ